MRGAAAHWLAAGAGVLHSVMLHVTFGAGALLVVLLHACQVRSSFEAKQHLCHVLQSTPTLVETTSMCTLYACYGAVLCSTHTCMLRCSAGTHRCPSTATRSRASPTQCWR
jgi:hypothetical protein